MHSFIQGLQEIEWNAFFPQRALNKHHPHAFISLNSNKQKLVLFSHNHIIYLPRARAFNMLFYVNFIRPDGFRCSDCYRNRTDLCVANALCKKPTKKIVFKLESLSPIRIVNKMLKRRFE